LTVRDLITRLQELPQTAPIYITRFPAMMNGIEIEYEPATNDVVISPVLSKRSILIDSRRTG
jgi:hypothetical protein